MSPKPRESVVWCNRTTTNRRFAPGILVHTHRPSKAKRLSCESKGGENKPELVKSIQVSGGKNFCSANKAS